MKYRRLRLEGGCYFFTVVTANRHPFFEDPENVSLLKKAFAHVKRNHPFRMPAYVILPDHMHCIWQLPMGDDDFSLRWRLIKHFVTRGWNGARPVWQKRYWEHCIRDEKDFNQHLDYIHINAVKHGLVTSPEEWTLSSYRHYMEKGWYEEGWGSHVLDMEGEFGE